MAGSEPFDYNNNTKQQKEQIAISKSLSFFITVMLQLNKEGQVQYLNSKLTGLLQSELGNIYQHIFYFMNPY